MSARTREQRRPTGAAALIDQQIRPRSITDQRSGRPLAGLLEADRLLDEIEARRRRCCGLCGGSGEYPARSDGLYCPGRPSPVCPACDGTGRGGMRVEPGPLRGEVLVEDQMAEYRRARAARERRARAGVAAVTRGRLLAATAPSGAALHRRASGRRR